MTNHVEAGVEISSCGLYRYRLWRRWGPGPKVLWIMLNPSTADGHVDDPTIRRCASFTKAWGCSGFEVVNLFALRATDPRELMKHHDPYGPASFDHLAASLRKRWQHRVAAWGRAGVVSRGRLCGYESYMQRLDRGDRLECLGITKGGHPRHPLYVAKAQRLEPWPSAITKDPNA